ncbi:hypothetical protein BD413DRAFT_480886 [Trametes elegans]|nr:hypothetical protein BD413DRAFT_480886 [Trametes elegans]
MPPHEDYAAYAGYGVAGSPPGSTHSYGESESAGSARGRDNSRKIKISLDPSQPLTIEGKPRARVYVACDRCRVRKLRCDGAKPACYNCERAAHMGAECQYDSEPKRRGQDKAPRTRSAVGHRKPRRPAVRKGEQDATAGQSVSDHFGA